MCFKESRVVNNGREQGRERPQKEGGEELSDDWILENTGADRIVMTHFNTAKVQYIPSVGCFALWLFFYTYIEILHWFCHIEFVHGGDDDGRGGEEEQEEEEDRVDDKAADPPGESSHRQMLPVG